MNDLYKWMIKQDCKQNKQGKPVVVGVSVLVNEVGMKQSLFSNVPLLNCEVTLTSDNFLSINNKRMRFKVHGTSAIRQEDKVLVQGPMFKVLMWR